MIMNETCTEFTIMKDDKILAKGNPDKIREKLEELMAERLNHFVLLEANDDDGELEVYLHTDNYELHDEKTINNLEALKITESNSIEGIKRLLNVTIV